MINPDRPSKQASSRRHRRTNAEMAVIRQGLKDLAIRHKPVSVRQCFYLAVAAGLVEKTEADYQRTVCRLLSEMRLDGSLPWDAVKDHTRQSITLRATNSLEDALRDTARFYRRRLWTSQSVRVECWLEKRTLLGPLENLALDYDVPIYPCNGYPSLSFLHDAIMLAAGSRKPTVLLYFGDHDPSGQDIERQIVKRKHQWAPDADITLRRIAVTPGQIEKWGLPTRPTKATDTRAARFKGESVEVEAIPPDRLRALLKAAIHEYIDGHEWAVVQAAEKDEKRILGMLGYGDFQGAAAANDLRLGYGVDDDEDDWDDPEGLGYGGRASPM